MPCVKSQLGKFRGKILAKALRTARSFEASILSNMDGRRKSCRHKYIYTCTPTPAHALGTRATIYNITYTSTRSPLTPWKIARRVAPHTQQPNHPRQHLHQCPSLNQGSTCAGGYQQHKNRTVKLIQTYWGKFLGDCVSHGTSATRVLTDSAALHLANPPQGPSSSWPRPRHHQHC